MVMMIAGIALLLVVAVVFILTLNRPEQISNVSDSSHALQTGGPQGADDESISRVERQILPVFGNQEFVAERKHARFQIEISPQAVGVYTYDEAVATRVYVVAGSKLEAFDELAMKLCGRYSREGELPEQAFCGDWLKGDRYQMRIVGQQQFTAAEIMQGLVPPA